MIFGWRSVSSNFVAVSWRKLAARGGASSFRPHCRKRYLDSGNPGQCPITDHSRYVLLQIPSLFGKTEVLHRAANLSQSRGRPGRLDQSRPGVRYAENVRSGGPGAHRSERYPRLSLLYRHYL